MVERIRCVVPAGDRCGEAATWSAEDGILYWSDVNRFLIHALDTRSNAVRSWLFDEPVVALSLIERSDDLVVALGSRLIRWDSKSDRRTDLGFRCPGWPDVRFNDGRAGPDGAFWVGSMANNVGQEGEANEVAPGRGELYCVGRGGSAAVHKSGLGIANTVCWSPDGSQFYFGDTMQNTIWAYDFDLRSSKITGERAFFAGFDRGHPDGSAMDSQGFLWNCRFGGGCVVRVAPSGKIDRIVEMPVKNVTTCAFGGPELKTLYITTASILAKPLERLAGSLFALDVEVPGMEAFRAKV